MKLSERIDLLVYLGEYLINENEALTAVINKTYLHNRWFIKENTQQSIKAIQHSFLQKDLLSNWVSNYSIDDIGQQKSVGLILAGNIPLVGFHDILAVFVAGHTAKVKLSEKDKWLIPHFVEVMGQKDERIHQYFDFVDRLSDFDAVIATGSNNTARYFDAYFGKYPNVIRKNRNGVAILSGKESKEELHTLGGDIFQYFGLGCRNVSKVYLPAGYEFQPLLEALHEYNEIVLHDKYKNNFDYNYTLLILNGVPHQSNGCILMTEDESLQSRIAQLNYEFYEDQTDLKQKIEVKLDDIQCIVGQAIDGLEVFPFGAAQKPGLMDYADGVDTMDFLTKL